ncbi:MAG: hypothetical protein M3O15_02870 [Acidobacteriota bacterium]|nr:hypothetical protein [Acidobacteriota bacterium]
MLTALLAWTAAARHRWSDLVPTGKGGVCLTDGEGHRLPGTPRSEIPERDATSRAVTRGCYLDLTWKFTVRV